MRIFRALIAGLSDVSRAEMASALANLTSSKDCRETLVCMIDRIYVVCIYIEEEMHTTN